jgi:hypothetical protein
MVITDRPLPLRIASTFISASSRGRAAAGTRQRRPFIAASLGANAVRVNPVAGGSGGGRFVLWMEQENEEEIDAVDADH